MSLRKYTMRVTLSNMHQSSVTTVFNKSCFIQLKSYASTLRHVNLSLGTEPINFLSTKCRTLESITHCTRGRDEVIAKSPIWLKLYQMNIWNPSRKDQKSFLQNMN